MSPVAWSWQLLNRERGGSIWPWASEASFKRAEDSPGFGGDLVSGQGLMSSVRESPFEPATSLEVESKFFQIAQQNHFAAQQVFIGPDFAVQHNEWH
jgi:hypothetical protein